MNAQVAWSRDHRRPGMEERLVESIEGGKLARDFDYLARAAMGLE